MGVERYIGLAIEKEFQLNLIPIILRRPIVPYIHDNAIFNCIYRRLLSGEQIPTRMIFESARRRAADTYVVPEDIMRLRLLPFIRNFREVASDVHNVEWITHLFWRDYPLRQTKSEG